MNTSIAERYADIDFLLGEPLTDVISDNRDLPLQRFQHGTLIHTPDFGARILRGAIEESWLNSENHSNLGFPVTDQSPSPDQEEEVCYFQHGCLHWNIQTRKIHRTNDLPKRIHVHIKVIKDPALFKISALMAKAELALAPAGISILQPSKESLSTLSKFLSLEIAYPCQLPPTRSDQLSEEQNLLFKNRNYAESIDIVLYFVREIVPREKGCASHPFDRPSAVIDSYCYPWTPAHEIGHVLGLTGRNCSKCLMREPTAGLDPNKVPSLNQQEISQMRNSPLTRNL